ncbi:MAG: 16S rRNA (guanine(527)-N(7))-methyltransferase RsmG, partial [Rubrobacteraceae bacterium]
FMRGAAESLGISEANILSARAEEVGWHPDFRERFDVATARALASMPVLVEYCLPLVKVGGLVVAMKGKPSREELDLGSRAAEMLGGRLENVIEVPPLPDTEARDRCLVVIRKEAETSKKYPRRVGLPRQQPLGG